MHVLLFKYKRIQVVNGLNLYRAFTCTVSLPKELYHVAAFKQIHSHKRKCTYLHSIINKYTVIRNITLEEEYCYIWCCIVTI